MTTDTLFKGNTTPDSRQSIPQDEDHTNFRDDIPLLGRLNELDVIKRYLANDEDFWIIGAPGNGRRILVYKAAERIRATILEIDCMKATSSGQLLTLMGRRLDNKAFENPNAQTLIKNTGTEKSPELFSVQISQKSGLAYLKPSSIVLNKSEDLELTQKKQQQAFEQLINLLQKLAFDLGTRIVILFHSFEHIYSWDQQCTRKNQMKYDHKAQWEDFLRKEIERQDRVSYVLIGTGEPRESTIKSKISIENEQSSIEKRTTKTVRLRPLDNNFLEEWVSEFVLQENLTFNPDDEGLKKFLEAVNGHFGNTRALAQRLILFCKSDSLSKSDNLSKEGIIQSEPVESDNVSKKGIIQSEQVEKAIKSLLGDMSSVFEALLLSLPDTQLRILECLSLYPTPHPHKLTYISKHSLVKGGTLQGALKGLSEKGLIYDAQKDDYDYRLTFPLMALWIRRRLDITE